MRRSTRRLARALAWGLVVVAGAGAAVWSAEAAEPALPKKARVASVSKKLAGAVLGVTGTWAARGPFVGGRLSGIVASPQDPNTLFVSSNGGGVWRTTNNGASWARPGTYGMGDYSILALAWDRLRPGRLLAAAWNSLYASTDNGATWSAIVNGSIPGPLLPPDHPEDPKPFAQLKLSATEGYILYSRACFGLYYSADGTNFTQHYPFPGGLTNPENCIQSIAADDATGYVYFSTMATGIFDVAHVYRSTCPWTAAAPCLTWAARNSGLPTGVVAASLTWTGYANNLALVAQASRGSSTSKVFTYWDPPSCGSNYWCETTAFPSVSWSPRTIDYPGGDQLLVGTVLPYQTTDYGGSWTSFNAPMGHPDVRSFYWDNGLGYLWATTDGTNNDGSYANIVRWTWHTGVAPSAPVTVPVSGPSGLPAFQLYYAATVPAANNSGTRLFIGSQDNGGLCSDDRGVTWTGSGAGSSLGSGDWMSLVAAPSNRNRAYLRTGESTKFARSDNAGSAATCAGVTWTAVTPNLTVGAPALWTRAMTAVHPTNPNQVYFVRLRDVVRSTDGGNTLTATAEPPALPVSIYVDAAGKLYVGTKDGGAYTSSDNGATWTAWGLNASPPAAVMNIAYSSAGGGTFFLATTSGLYRLLPGGAWTLVTGGNGYVVNDVEVDPTCPQRVYAAFGFGGPYTSHRGGIVVSSDNGTTWTSITSGLDLHQGPVSNIEVDAGSARYQVAATYGQGTWIRDLGAAPTCP